MDYKTKIRHGEEVAEKILAGHKLETLKAELLSGDLYEKDVQNVMGTARKILSEKVGPAIQSHLLADTLEEGVEQFDMVDSEVMQDIVKEQLDSLGNQQRAKVAIMLRENKSPLDIHTAVDHRFYSKDMVNSQIQIADQIKVANKEAKGSGAIKLIIGVVLCLVGIGSYFTGVFWYGLILVGIGFIAQGFSAD